jgi:hypothetical protein
VVVVVEVDGGRVQKPEHPATNAVAASRTAPILIFIVTAWGEVLPKPVIRVPHSESDHRY